MCGIAGSFGPTAPDEARQRAALGLMARRGPDASGRASIRVGPGTATLLHTRLAIIDLDPRANQPFEAADCVIAFNGEIYNYVELRRELEAAGARFATDSDTEVIAHAWRRWGRDCLDRFEGMWALALVDRHNDVLFLARDRFGEKPLYWTCRDGTLWFASEAKALAALSGHALEPDLAQVARYLVNGYKALYKGPQTFFRDVHELPPATSAVLREPGAPMPETYWQLRHDPMPMSRADAVEGARAHLLRSVDYRLRADVPLAFCLSGGVDSGALASIAVKALGREVHAFSIVDHDPRYDERDNMAATVAALGCRQHTVHTSRAGFLDRLEAQVAYHDAPVATISYYVHDFLSEAIAEHGYKVAISGTGADEIFTGYYDHYAFWLAEMAGRPDYGRLLEEWRDGYGRFVRNPVLQDPEVFRKSPGERSHIYLGRERYNALMARPVAEDFAEETYAASALRNRMLNELRHEVVPVILREDDLNSMRHSVENRSPFLDRGLAEFAFTIPDEHLVNDGRLKSVLRDAVDGLLPDQVRQDRQKRGFNASIDSLLDRNDPDTVERLLAPGPIFDLVRRDAIEDWLRGDMSDNADSKFLFSFISAKLFLESDLAMGRGAFREAA